MEAHIHWYHHRLGCHCGHPRGDHMAHCSQEEVEEPWEVSPWHQWSTCYNARGLVRERERERVVLVFIIACIYVVRFLSLSLSWAFRREVLFSSIECYSLLGNSAVVLGVYVFRLHTVFFPCMLLVVRFVNFFFLLILLFFTLHWGGLPYIPIPIWFDMIYMSVFLFPPNSYPC